jgi:hypothetical protein
MPDLASRKEASTSCVVLPMDETMPIPVTTTRLIANLFVELHVDPTPDRRKVDHGQSQP